jgi:hypothetical protein
MSVEQFEQRDAAFLDDIAKAEADAKLQETQDNVLRAWGEIVGEEISGVQQLAFRQFLRGEHVTVGDGLG